MISHELKTIFIHIPNTGGTSVETALVGSDWWNIDPQTKHIDWREAKELYADYWASYLKFTIVRDPWDWLVSLYNSHGRDGNKTWEEYVRNPNLSQNEQSTMSQSKIIGGEMDCILRFERLNGDFIGLAHKLGIKVGLPHESIGTGRHKHYFELYTEELKEIVSELFQEDIRRFGYAFRSREIVKAQDYKRTVSALEQRIAYLEHELELERRSILKKILGAFR